MIVKFQKNFLIENSHCVESHVTKWNENLEKCQSPTVFDKFSFLVTNVDGDFHMRTNLNVCCHVCVGFKTRPRHETGLVVRFGESFSFTYNIIVVRILRQISGRLFPTLTVPDYHEIGYCKSKSIKNSNNYLEVNITQIYFMMRCLMNQNN